MAVGVKSVPIKPFPVLPWAKDQPFSVTPRALSKQGSATDTSPEAGSPGAMLGRRSWTHTKQAGISRRHIVSLKLWVEL
jgi:hypothetical protein